MSHPDWVAALVVGALFAIAAGIGSIVKAINLHRKELQRIREDNVAWRENNWNRESERH